MDTNNLMSSLREMIQADVHLQMIAAGVLHASPEDAQNLRDQYSRHETVVRTQLEALGKEASSYKRPPMYR